MVNPSVGHSKSHPRAGQISAAAADLLRSVGLTAWSIEGCAKQAKCAKGLVLHHHGTKEQLLTTVARDLSAARWTAWRAALSAGDVSALDAGGLQEHHDRSGRSLIELRLAGFESTLLGPAELTELARLLARALDVTPDDLPVPEVLEPLLEGYLLALQRNASSEGVREAFFRYWLSYVK